MKKKIEKKEKTHRGCSGVVTTLKRLQLKNLLPSKHPPPPLKYKQ